MLAGRAISELWKKDMCLFMQLLNCTLLFLHLNMILMSINCIKDC